MFGPVRICGRKNVPKTGGLLILANHISDADPPVMGIAIPRPARFMAKSELFKVPILGKIIAALRAFPVNRGAPDRAALRSAITFLQQGECVVMFPEGEVSETGEPLPLLPGAALVIKSAGVPALCAFIKGTRRIVPYGAVVPRPAFGGVSVTFGTPRSFDKTDEHKEIMKWVAQEFARLSGENNSRSC